MNDEFKGVDLEELYQEKFNEPVPLYNMNYGYRPIEEWEEIIKQAIRTNKPYSEEYKNDPNIRY